MCGISVPPFWLTPILPTYPTPPGFLTACLQTIHVKLGRYMFPSMLFAYPFYLMYGTPGKSGRVKMYGTPGKSGRVKMGRAYLRPPI